MEKKIVGGGPAAAAGSDGAAQNESAALENRLSFKAKRERNKQLKNKKRLKHEENEQKKLMEEEMLLADDVNEREDPADGDEQAAELERLRNINKKLRSKYKQAQQEIKNLAKENDNNKTELLDSIRMQEKDMQFNEKLVKIMLNEND